IITGEDGMCKSDVGYLCCCFSPQKRKSLICVSCYSVPEDYNYDLLDSIIMEHLWNEGGTLFLEDIDQLSKEGQKKITDILKKLNKNSNIKIIASSELPVEICVRSGKLLRQLRSILDEVRIELKPLKDYTNEINNMISMYLAKLDVRCASHVVGIKDEGIKLLSDYDWPENVRQFMRVINQLALTCNIPYIAQTEVKVAIKKERDNHKQATLVPVDLSGSLKEIETRIIKHVMIQEDMNQVKVEKRLEIGHSTLWRKLK
ncbi:MAG TPA: sigma-54-dependent transcriptional regulator, partial [Clostridium sp.]